MAQNSRPVPTARWGRFLQWAGVVTLAFLLSFLPLRQMLHLPPPNRPPSVHSPFPLGPTAVRADGGLTITKKALQPTVAPGGVLTYTLLVTNRSGVSLTNAAVVDDVPPNTTCRAVADVSGWATNLAYCQSNGIAVWDGGLLTDGVTLAFTYSVTVDQPRPDGSLIRNAAGGYAVGGYLFGTTTPLTDAGNRTITTPVTAPAWQIAKTVVPTGSVLAGKTLTYTLTYTNSGSYATSGSYVITDALPANTTFVSASGGGTNAGGIVTWNGSAALSPGQSASVYFIAQVNAPLAAGTVITNDRYRISGGNVFTPAMGAPVTVTVAAAPSLEITKSPAQATVRPGDSLTYTLTYQNSGNAVASGVVVTDTLPAGMRLISSQPPTDTAAGATYGWNIGALSPADGPQLITIVVALSATLTDGTLLTNTAAISGAGQPVVTGTAQVVIGTGPNLTLRKTASAGTVQAGELLTYTLAYTNGGNLPADTLRLTDTLPLSLTVVGVNGGAATLAFSSATTLVFTQSVLSPTQSGRITITARAITAPLPAAGRTLDNQAEVTTSPADVFPADNAGSVAVTVLPGPAMTITLPAVITAPFNRSTVITAAVTDRYGNPVQNATPVTFTLAAPGVITPTLAGTLNGVVSATLWATQPGTATLRAETGAASATATVTFLGTSLAIGKTDAPDPIAPGDRLIYTLAVTNTGGTNAANLTGVLVTDTLDSRLSLVSTSRGYTQNGDALIFNLGTISPGGSKTIRITTRVALTTANGVILTNTALAAANEVTATQAVTALTTVIVPTVNKTVAPEVVRAGELLTYTLLYHNQSGGLVSGLRLTDTLPAQVASIESINAGGATVVASSPPVLVFTKDTLAAGQGLTITVVGRVITAPWSATLTDLTNWLTATSATDPTPQGKSALSNGRPGSPATVTLQAPALASWQTSVPVTATVRDAYGNPVLNGTAVHFSIGPVGSVSPATDGTSNGIAYSAVSAAVTGTAIITAESGGVIATATIEFAAPALALQKTVAPNPVVPGRRLTYTLRVTNTGTVEAASVTITDTLDGRLTFGGANPAPTAQQGRDYVFALGNLSPGEARSILLTATVAATLDNGSAVTNTATAIADKLPAPQSAVAVVGVQIPSLVKSVFPAIVQPGETLTYTLIFTNRIGQSLNALRIEDAMPDRIASIVMLDAGSTTPLTATLPKLVFSHTGLPPGGTVTITIVGRVVTAPWPAAPVSLTNVATATADFGGTVLFAESRQVSSRGRPGTPYTLTLQAVPTRTTLGKTVALTVAVRDRYANPVLNGTSVVFSTTLPGTQIVSAGATRNGLVTGTLTATATGVTTVTAIVSGTTLSARQVVRFEEITGYRLYLPVMLKE